MPKPRRRHVRLLVVELLIAGRWQNRGTFHQVDEITGHR
jgi:hypothetical protein